MSSIEGHSVEAPPTRRPRFLRPHDDAWLRSACEAHVDLADMPMATVETRWREQLSDQLRAAGASAHSIALVRRELSRLSSTRMESPCSPRLLREALFPLAAQLPRDVALARIAAELAIDPSVVEAALFADRRAERRLVLPKTTPDLASLRERCNLALVQAWLLRCTELRVTVRENLRAVVRWAKLVGLLVDFAEHGDATEVRASGPLALFRRTVKYGRALARFFPCVVASPGYVAVADCIVQGEPRRIRIQSGDPLAAIHRVPRATDSALERALVRDLRRLETPWRLVREDRVVRLDGGALFFPDFSLVRGGERVLVEIVGFHTEEYLRKKTRALAAVRERCIVCVDASLDCSGHAFSSGEVLYFDKRVDAAALVAAAEQAPRST